MYKRQYRYGVIVPIKTSYHGDPCRLGARPTLCGGCGGGRGGRFGRLDRRDVVGAFPVGGGWSPDWDVTSLGDGAAVDGYWVTGYEGLDKWLVGQWWPCVLRRAALDSVSRVKEVLGSIPPATATEIT